MSVEVGDDHRADANVEEIRKGLAAMEQQHKALQDGRKEPSLYEQRAAAVRERERAFHKRAAAKLEEQHEEMRAPVKGKPTSRWLPSEQVDDE
jgi:hypothetical protein